MTVKKHAKGIISGLVAGVLLVAGVPFSGGHSGSGNFPFSVGTIANAVQTPGQGTHAHSFGAWNQTKAPTAVEEGVETRTCSCGAKETRSIPKLAATMDLNAEGTLPMKVKQVSTGIKVSGLAAGDSVASVSSSDPAVVQAELSGGEIVLRARTKKGTAVITVQTASGLKKTFNIKVTKKAVKTKKIAVESKKLAMAKGTTFQIKAQPVPATAQKARIRFTSTNKRVAAVSRDGVVTAKKKGKATIKIKCGGKTVKVKVVVSD